MFCFLYRIQNVGSSVVLISFYELLKLDKGNLSCPAIETKRAPHLLELKEFDFHLECRTTASLSVIKLSLRKWKKRSGCNLKLQYAYVCIKNG